MRSIGLKDLGAGGFKCEGCGPDLAGLPTEGSGNCVVARGISFSAEPAEKSDEARLVPPGE